MSQNSGGNVRGLLGRLGFGRLVTVAIVCLAAAGVASAGVSGLGPFGHDQVGQRKHGAILLPSNQFISPVGKRILVNNARLVSSTLSPDGTMLAALSWNNSNGFLSILDVKRGQVVQQVGTGKTGDPSLGDATVAADGPFYSPDGRSLWFPQSADLIRFTVKPDGTVASPVTINLPTTGPRDTPDALPSGMAFSSDGRTAYVALNGLNTLGVLDTATNQLVRQIPVGNAPRQVVIDGNRAFVSNEGGRPARGGDFTNLSDGTPIVANHSTGAATTGTVSVVDLGRQTQTRTIRVGLQPTAMYLRGSALFVANSNDDSVSVINARTGRVAQTVRTNPVPGATVGSYANAITMPDSEHVLVSIGRDNAIAVYRYRGLSTPLKFEGLLPTDWYPVQVQADSALGGKIVVTNDKGVGARGPISTIEEGPGTHPATSHNTYDDTGSVTTFKLPPANQLKAYTKTVFADNAWNYIHAVNGGIGDTVPSVIPAHIGGRSPIKHIFVIVKENRTYDQVLGDLGQGNGDRSLAQFGQMVTPNQHAMAWRFGTMDNFYDPGTLSADGHNWIVQANANDYVEKQFGAFNRSYPSQGGDALAYQRSGFLWNAAQRAGLSVRDYGEYANFFTVPNTGAPTWNQWYKDSQILEGKASGPLPVPIHKYRTYSDIPSLNKIINPSYPRFDLNVPDQYRVDIWQRDFRQAEKTGRLPNLNLMWVMTDHTSGVGSGDPYPIAQVADNDLAVGRIVSEISHSRFWKNSAIFVLEDDPQDGVDHVDGHRSLLWVASPYSRPGVNDSYYSQVNVVRTVEQILGIQPMNQVDHSAAPMYSAFTDRPNLAPFKLKSNRVPLTLGVPGYSFAKGMTPALRRLASVPAAERHVYTAWARWSRRQHFGAGNIAPDSANPAQLNRVDWYSAHGWQLPYPGDTQIYAPDQVPGHNLPAQDIAGG